MAAEINSQKTAYQVGSRFYTLSRKPKKSSADLGSIINMNQTTTVEASLLKLNEEGSFDFSIGLGIDLDGSEFSDFKNDSSNAMPRKNLCEDQLNPTALDNESVIATADGDGSAEIENVAPVLNTDDFGSGSRSPDTLYVDDASRAFASRTINDFRSSLPRSSYISSHSNSATATNAWNAIPTNSSGFASVATSPRIVSVVGSVDVDQEPFSNIRSQPKSSATKRTSTFIGLPNVTRGEYVDVASGTSIDDCSFLPRTSYISSSSNCATASGERNAIPTTSRGFASVATSPRSTSVVGSVDVDQELLSGSGNQRLSSSTQTTSTVVARPVVAVKSRPVPSFLSRSIRPIILPSSTSTSLNRSISNLNESFSGKFKINFRFSILFIVNF